MVDYLANGLHHYSMYYFRSITMTTDKTKAALDALNKLTAYSPFAMEEMEEDALGEYVKLSDVENLIVALTAQAEAQPADDEVREAVEWAVLFKDAAETRISGEEYLSTDHKTVKNLSALIRATTRAPDAGLVKALESIAEMDEVRDYYEIAELARKALAAHKAAAPKACAAPKWQPMTTAPKNGERIILKICNTSASTIGYFDEMKGNWFGQGSKFHPIKPDGWAPLPE